MAPIIGVDYKWGKVNLAAKYEFKTRMRLKNKSANSLSAEGIAMLDKFADGRRVPVDQNGKHGVFVGKVEMTIRSKR